MPELQSVDEDWIAYALAHPKPAAARQTTTALRKEDTLHEESFSVTPPISTTIWLR